MATSVVSAAKEKCRVKSIFDRGADATALHSFVMQQKLSGFNTDIVL